MILGNRSWDKEILALKGIYGLSEETCTSRQTEENGVNGKRNGATEIRSVAVWWSSIRPGRWEGWGLAGQGMAAAGSLVPVSGEAIGGHTEKGVGGNMVKSWT